MEEKMKYETLKKGSKPNFPTPISVGERPWGTEDLLILIPGKYMMKRLRIKKGSKGGLQFHRIKDEGGILISGKLKVRYDDGKSGLEERIIQAGEAFHFPPGIVHQEEALEDCEIIEVSTPVFNDRVRAETEYGLNDVSGLPTTQISEIEFK